jgi:VWFA-related protein
LSLIVLCSAAALAQDTPPEDQAPATTERHDVPTFQSKVNLVLVRVVVRDAHGRPVGNLTKDDFQLFDKRKRQTIASFSVVKRASGAPEAKTATTARAADSERDSERSGSAAANHSPERCLIYLFDDLNIGFADLVAVREAA